MTLDTTTVLLATAEIGVAFAGFAGLAALLGSRHTMDDVRIDIMRLRAIVEGSLSVAAAAILPLVLLSMETGDEVTWRFCSGVFLALSLVLVGVWTRRIRSATRARVPFDRRIVWMFYGIAAIMTMLLGSNLLGLSQARLFSLYLSSLYIVLFGTALLFLRLVASLVASTVKTDGSGRET